MSAQSTDSENSKPFGKSTARDDDVKSRNLGSMQAIALKKDTEQKKITGTGGDDVTANVQGGDK